MNEKPVPAEVRGWNWGAFFLTWIWGIGNKVWISLLCLLPLVNLVMVFVLGIKGNEWAWKSGNYSDVAQFHKVQKIWGIVGASLFLLSSVVGFMGLATLAEMGRIQGGELYHSVLDRAQQSQQVKAALGEPVDPVPYILGKQECDNKNNCWCDLQIPLLGPRGKGTLYVVGKQHGDEKWKFERLTVKPDQGQEIDLNAATPADTPAAVPKGESDSSDD